MVTLSHILLHIIIARVEIREPKRKTTLLNETTKTNKIERKLNVHHLYNFVFGFFFLVIN